MGRAVGTDAIVQPLFFALVMVLIARITNRDWVLLGLSAVVVAQL